MNFKEACKNLEIKEKDATDSKELRKKYYTMALKYHPDKYKEDNGEKFKSVKDHEKVFTDDSVIFITEESDTLYGIGFESDSDLEEWKIFSIFGIGRPGF